MLLIIGAPPEDEVDEAVDEAVEGDEEVDVAELVAPTVKVTPCEER